MIFFFAITFFFYCFSDKQFGKSKWSLADLVDMLSLTSSTDGPKQKQVQSNLYPHQKLGELTFRLITHQVYHFINSTQ